jgi:hypothetical protein
VRLQQSLDALDGLQLGLQPLPARVVRQPDFASQRRQAPVGVVLAQQQPVLGAAGEHAVRFVHAAGHQVVDQHADISLLAAQNQRPVAALFQRRIRTGDQALRGGFFVARRAVDLAREVQAVHQLGLQRRSQLIRRAVIVFDRIAVAHDARVVRGPRSAGTSRPGRRAADWSRCR